MKQLPSCPICSSKYTYEDRAMFVCPECSHEWPREAKVHVTHDDRIIKDANGNVLQDGDTVTVIKELKIAY